MTRPMLPYSSFCILWRKKGGSVEIFLIQEESRHNRIKWKCPGGKGEDAKDGGIPVRTVVRELREEVWLTARQEEFQSIKTEFLTDSDGRHIRCFFTRETNEVLQPNPSEKVVRGAWISKKAIEHLYNTDRLVHPHAIANFLRKRL